MRIPFLSLKVERAPRALSRRELTDALEVLAGAVEEVQKRAEANRQAIYRDSKAQEAASGGILPPQDLPLPPQNAGPLRPGDPIPDWMR